MLLAFHRAEVLLTIYETLVEKHMASVEVMNPESIVRILEDLGVGNAIWEFVKIQVKDGNLGRFRRN